MKRLAKFLGSTSVWYCIGFTAMSVINHFRNLTQRNRNV